MKVVVEVDKGPSRGTQYEIGVRSYRALGRAGGKDVTVQLTEEGDAVLDADDIERVEEHLARRGRPAPEESERLRIGSFHRGRDIMVEDEKVSRTHAMIFVDEEGVSIVDLLSTNGTHVNGRRVGDADLNDEDIVHVGKTRFIIRVSV
jgi:pSer/pThr/pTyr-binding forkhead associated (FHA) protein